MKGYLVLFFDIHKNYLTAHIVRKFHKLLFSFIKLLFCLVETRIIHQIIAPFAVLLKMSFCSFRKTFHRNPRGGGGGGLSESMDRQGCAILALEVVPKKFLFQQGKLCLSNISSKIASSLWQVAKIN